MPFSLAHPAAIVPIWRLSQQRLPLAALVIGSMAPDFEYLLKLRASGSFAHSATGLLLFCLPIGWLSLWLYDRFGRSGLQVLLPPGWHLPYHSRAPGRYAWMPVSAALLIGAITHVTWDAFTHRTGFFVTRLPTLSRTVHTAWFDLPLYNLLQHASTLAGLLTIACMLRGWVARQPHADLLPLLSRALMVTMALGVAGLLNGYRFLNAGNQAFVVAAGVGVVFCALIGPVLIGMVRTARR